MLIHKKGSQWTKVRLKAIQRPGLYIDCENVIKIIINGINSFISWRNSFFIILEEVGAVIGDVMSLVSIYNCGASVGLINLTGCDTSLEQDMGW